MSGHFPKPHGLLILQRPLPRDIELPSSVVERASGSQRVSWFALFTYPRHEKRVAETLLRRELESYLPLYCEKRTWKNRQTVNLALPLFPSYVFARFSRRDRVRVLSVPGVVNIVEGGGASGGAIADHYIEQLRAGVQLGRVRPYRDLILGDWVQIVAGPFTGLEGWLTRIRSEFRVVVSIAMIGQSVSIEVSRDEILPVSVSSREKRL